MSHLNFLWCLMMNFPYFHSWGKSQYPQIGQILCNAVHKVVIFTSGILSSLQILRKIPSNTNSFAKGRTRKYYKCNHIVAVCTTSTRKSGQKGSVSLWSDRTSVFQENSKHIKFTNSLSHSKIIQLPNGIPYREGEKGSKMPNMINLESTGIRRSVMLYNKPRQNYVLFAKF